MSVIASGSGGGGSGGVVAGPGTAIADNRVVRGDTAGIQGSGVTLDDSNNLIGTAHLQSGDNSYWLRNGVDLRLGSGMAVLWSSGNVGTGSVVGLVKQADNALGVTDGGAGFQAVRAAGLRLGIVTKTTTYTATATDYTILCDTTTAGFTVTLPAAATVPGQVLNIKKISADVNTLTIDGNGAETIDGAATQTTAIQWTTFRLQSDGASWFLL